MKENNPTDKGLRKEGTDEGEREERSSEENELEFDFCSFSFLLVFFIIFFFRSRKKGGVRGKEREGTEASVISDGCTEG